MRVVSLFLLMIFGSICFGAAPASADDCENHRNGDNTEQFGWYWNRDQDGMHMYVTMEDCQARLNNYCYPYADQIPDCIPWDEAKRRYLERKAAPSPLEPEPERSSNADVEERPRTPIDRAKSAGSLFGYWDDRVEEESLSSRDPASVLVAWGQEYCAAAEAGHLSVAGCSNLGPVVDAWLMARGYAKPSAKAPTIPPLAETTITTLFEYWDEVYGSGASVDEGSLVTSANSTFCPYARSAPQTDYTGCEDLPNAAREWRKNRGLSASESPLEDDIGAKMSEEPEEVPLGGTSHVVQATRQKERSVNGIRTYVDYDNKGGFRVNIVNSRKAAIVCNLTFSWITQIGNGGGNIGESSRSDSVLGIKIRAGRLVNYGRDFSPGYWVAPFSVDYKVSCRD